MKDQLLMSPNNGEVVVGVPLFRRVEDDVVDVVQNYTICFNMSKPVAYAVDAGKHGIMLMNAKFVEEKLINLGDL